MTIQLLDGPVTGPGYYRMTNEAYHLDPAPRPSVSAGLLTTLIDKTPRDAWFTHPRLNPPEPTEDEDEDEDGNKTAFDFGNVAHTLILGEGDELVVIDAKDWRTKAAKEQRAAAFEAGKQPCLAKIYEKAERCVEAVRQQLADDPDNFDAFTAPGHSEVNAFAQLETFAGRMWARCRMDRRTHDMRIYDFKTLKVGTDSEDFSKYLVREGRDIQAVHYQQIEARLQDVSWDAISFRFVVVDPDPPHTLVVVEQSAQMAQWSQERWQWAIDKWAKCGAAGRWPGRTPATHYIDAPGYAQTSWEAKVQMDAAGERMVEARGQ